MDEEKYFSFLALCSIVDSSLLTKLSGSAAKVLIVLVRHTNSNGFAFPSLKTIAKESGVSKCSAERGVAELKKLGLKTKKMPRMKWTNKYFVQEFLNSPLVSSMSKEEKVSSVITSDVRGKDKEPKIRAKKSPLCSNLLPSSVLNSDVSSVLTSESRRYEDIEDKKERKKKNQENSVKKFVSKEVYDEYVKLWGEAETLSYMKTHGYEIKANENESPTPHTPKEQNTSLREKENLDEGSEGLDGNED